MEHVSRAESTILQMVTSKIKWDNVTKYKMSYSFRFLTANQVYKLFLHQAITLTTDEKGRVGKSLNIHTDISQIATENNDKVSLIGLMGEPSYFDIGTSNVAEVAANDYTVFSKREVQIIRLIAAGETTLGISEQLEIALDTAKNHRRNILKKAGVKNTAELIKLCMQKGLV